MIKYLYISFLIFICLPNAFSFSQSSYEVVQKIESLYNDKQYYTALNMCREILSQCEENPSDVCWFTNFMKEVLRIKGLSEYEIYKSELSDTRLKSAIQSLEQSYELFNDPEVLYIYGYLSAYENIVLKNFTELKGLIDAWLGILELYGQNNWLISSELSQKTISYIKICERYDIEIPSKNYHGNFARYMITTACNFLEKGKQTEKDREYILSIKKKYRIIN